MSKTKNILKIISESSILNALEVRELTENVASSMIHKILNSVYDYLKTKSVFLTKQEQKELVKEISKTIQRNSKKQDIDTTNFLL